MTSGSTLAVGGGAVVAVDSGAGCELVADSLLLQADKGKRVIARITITIPGSHFCSLLFAFMLCISFFDIMLITDLFRGFGLWSLK